jgi:hypothetical protein
MPAKNRTQNYGSDIAPATMLRAITPHDTDELEWVTNGIVAAGAGMISIVAVGDTEPVPVPIVIGQTLVIRAKIIRSTGTTATGIVALIS